MQGPRSQELRKLKHQALQSLPPHCLLHRPLLLLTDGKAVLRATRALPHSPRKKAAVVKKLSDTFVATSECKGREGTSEFSERDRMVQEFYESDLISRQLPGRKDFVTVKINGQKERLQKRILLSTVMETYRQFKEDHSDVQIGKSKFASLRPPNVLPVSEKDHNVCCCAYHENFEMIVKGIKMHIPLFPDSETLISKSVCVNRKVACSLGECEHCQDVNKLTDNLFQGVDLMKTCSYMQWKENKKVNVSCTLGEAKIVFSEQLHTMRRHCFIAKIQLKQVKEMKTQLKDNEAILHVDFAENFQIKQQDEIMSAHWLTEGVTIYTAVINTKNGATSFGVVSDELRHDKYSVAAFNRAILDKASSILPEAINILHVISNGAGSQFKNRYTLSNILKPQVIHPNLEEVDWTFFGTAHGKRPIDGVGGTLKRAVWRRILQGRALINTAEDFAKTASIACPNINVLVVPRDTVARVQAELDSKWSINDPQNIPDIRKAHYFRKGSKCEILRATVTPYLPSIKSDISLRSSVIFTLDNEPEPSTVTKCTIQSDKVKISVDLKQYYAVDYVDKFYIGRVTSKEGDGFWKMKFLHTLSILGEPVFNWPRHDDVDKVHENAIFYGPVELTGTLKDFRITNYKDIESVFKNLN